MGADGAKSGPVAGAPIRLTATPRRPDNYMPSYKNHHYVPKAHLAPFSVNGEAKAIHLFNINRGRCFANAPVRSQCSKNYFYGEPGDTKLEHELQELEGHYASTVRQLARGSQPSLDDMMLLKAFTVIQWSRTDMAVQRMREHQALLYSAAHEGVEAHLRPSDPDLSDRAIIRQSMRLSTVSMRGVADLKTLLVANKSRVEFITSDNPAVLTSRFYIQRLRRSDFGISNTGIMFYLPLTPRLLFMCYDGGAYVVPEKSGRRLAIASNSDAEALNDLQLLNAGANVYFADWDSAATVQQQYTTHAAARRVGSAKLNVLVPDGYGPRGQRFRTANTEERHEARETLIHIQTQHFMPARWLSKVQFRNPVRGFSNGTGAGTVRHREWLQSGFNEFQPRPNW